MCVPTAHHNVISDCFIITGSKEKVFINCLEEDTNEQFSVSLCSNE